MSVAGIDKITLFFPAAASRRALALLHDMACVEIVSGVATPSASFAENDVSSQLDLLRSAVETISRAALSRGPGSAVLAAPPSAIGREAAGNHAARREILKVCEQAAQLSAAAAEAEASARQCESEAARLEPWKEVNAKLSELSDGSAVRFFAGQIPHARSDEFFAALKKYPSHAITVSDDGKIISFGMAYPAFFAAEVSALSRKFGVTHVPYSSSDKSPAEALSQLRALRAAHIGRAARRMEKLAGLSRELPSLKAAHDALLEVKTLSDASRNLRAAGRINYFTGWIPAKKIAFLKKSLETAGIEYHLISRPASSGDDAPVVLENPAAVAPFEIVTDLYGKPSYTEADPTPWVAPFFAVFFGVCMADALYGLIIAAGGVAGIKYAKTSSARKFMKLVLYCGVSTAVFGALTGGYFGNLLDRFDIFSFARPFKNRLKVFDPLEKSIVFLGGCLVAGFFQTMLGSFLKLAADIGDKNWREAVLGDLSVIGVQTSFPLLVIGELFGVKVVPTQIAFSVLGVSAAALMANQWLVNEGMVLKIFQMFFGVYGAITGNALSDILSYSRLFALGLSTALLAMVLNEVAALLFSSPVGFPFGILVLLLFHPFILLIGSLGAYVHTSRLQYLEFFNKFFRGGGREMRPLRWIKKYTV